MITQQKVHEIFNIQKQCIRLITRQKKDVDPTCLFNKLRIPKIKDIIHIAMCKLGHNISHKHYPSPILNLFDKFGGQKSQISYSKQACTECSAASQQTVQ